MKALLFNFLLILLIGSCFEAVAQEYYVLQVKGTVTRKGVAIKSNEIILPNDKLVFSAATDAIAVVNPKTGRFIIKPVPSEKTNELVAYVKEAIAPGNKKLSTRNGSINNVIDFQAYFKEPVLLLNEILVPVSPGNFPLGENSFFFIRYTFNQEEINKKISYDKENIIISRSELYSIDGNPVNPELVTNLKLFYLKDNQVQSISPLALVTPDLHQLKEEVELIKTTYSSATKLQINEEILGYFIDFYGKTDQINLDHWLRKEGH